MITSLDESAFLGSMQFDDESLSKISKDTIILSGNMTNEGVLKKFNQESLFLFELYKSFNKDNKYECKDFDEWLAEEIKSAKEY